MPYARLIDPATGRFLPPAELARVFAEAGVDVTHLPREVVVYCNGGVTCTVPLAALRMLGRDDVAVYDGSWNEWGNDRAAPHPLGVREPLMLSRRPQRAPTAVESQQTQAHP